MKTSRERILVTHVGSLPRNDELSDLLIQREEGGAVDTGKLAQAMDKSVQQVVDKQAAAGVDIGNDGEQQRVGFQTYVAQRMSGFAGESKRRRGRDYEEFPELVEVLTASFSEAQPDAECAGSQKRASISRNGPDSGRDPSIEAGGPEQKCVCRVLHDGAFPRHRFDDDA